MRQSKFIVHIFTKIGPHQSKVDEANDENESWSND